MTITVLRSKQVPDRIELVARTKPGFLDQWGVRHRDTNRTVWLAHKQWAIESYDLINDDLDVEDAFGFQKVA